MESKVATLESHLPQEPTFGIREPRWIVGWATPAISKYQNIRKQLRREACDHTLQLLDELRLGDATLVEGHTIGVFSCGGPHSQTSRQRGICRGDAGMTRQLLSVWPVGSPGNADGIRAALREVALDMLLLWCCAAVREVEVAR